MNKIKVTLIAFLMIFVLSGCSLKTNGNVLIKVNNTSITKSEYEKAFDSVASNNMFSQIGIDVKKEPESPFGLMMREKVVTELLIKALLNEEMAKNKISVSKEDMEKAEKEVIDRFGSKDQFNKLLKSNGISYDKFKKDLEDEIKLKKYVDSIAMVSVGESEARKYYDENKDKFQNPERVRASHILIASDPNKIKSELKEKDKSLSDRELEIKTQEIMAKNLKTAEKIRAEVKKVPGDFARIAKEKSQDPASAVRGGDLGFFAKGDMVQEFSDKAFSLPANTISEVVKTPYGYHIIKVTDRAEAGTVAFDDCKQDIINFLESQDKVSILKNKIESLRKTAKIEYADKNYDPEVIQKKIKESYDKDSSGTSEFSDQNNDGK